MAFVQREEQWFPLEPDVMEIVGRFDDSSCISIEEDVSLCIQSGSRRMLLECHELTYITGAGLRALLSMSRTMKERDGKLVVCALQPQVQEMFTATGLDGLVPVYGDQAEAAMALAG